MALVGDAGPIDWEKITRQLLENMPSLKPWEIGKLTLAEVEWALRPAGEHRPAAGRGVCMGQQDMAAALDKWNRLTPKERLLRRLEN